MKCQAELTTSLPSDNPELRRNPHEKSVDHNQQEAQGDREPSKSRMIPTLDNDRLLGGMQKGINPRFRDPGISDTDREVTPIHLVPHPDVTGGAFDRLFAEGLH